MTEREAFATFLRRHRERMDVTLPAIAASSRIRLELLERLERNDLDGWPRGLYARAYIRDYATAVGLDPEDTVDEFCRLYPHGDRRAHGTMKDMASIVASESEWRDEFDPEFDRRKPPAVNPPARPRGIERMRAAIAAAGRSVRAAAAALTRSIAGEGSARIRRRGHAEQSR